MRVMILAMLVCVLVLGLAAAAAAAPWPDLESSTLVSYGVTVDQVSQVSSGFADGTWQPWRSITRAQFAKMAVTAFGLEQVSPAAPTFADVPSDDSYYPYIEAAAAAGLMGGVGGGLFAPAASVTREQAIAVVARKVAADEGVDLAAMAEVDVAAALEDFGDAASISPGLRDEMAFAVGHALVKGTAEGNLVPKAIVSRIAAATLIIRAMGPQLLLDTTDNGTTITVRTGDVLTIVLKGNPTTGYTWESALSEQDAAVLEQMGEPVYVADSDLIGAGGTFTFRFKALKAGEAVLTLNYARPWESVPALETFSVGVKVADTPLEGTAWKLEGWSADSVAPGDYDVTAAFENGQVGGQAPVNLYSGPYTVGVNGSFKVGTLISTKMAGSEEAMRAETLYFELLGQAKAYRLVDDRLTLLDANLNELLIFVPAN
jgi:inhibitor of cysteine peptidase